VDRQGFKPDRMARQPRMVVSLPEMENIKTQNPATEDLILPAGLVKQCKITALGYGLPH